MDLAVEWSGGAVVGRSMASAESALSSVVANGHQTVHSGSSTPSKIPYGGFSRIKFGAAYKMREIRPSGLEGGVGLIPIAATFPRLEADRWSFFPVSVIDKTWLISYISVYTGI
jgi:hypothetical protein